MPGAEPVGQRVAGRGDLKLNGDVLHNRRGHLAVGPSVMRVVRLLHNNGRDVAAHALPDAAR